MIATEFFMGYGMEFDLNIEETMLDIEMDDPMEEQPLERKITPPAVHGYDFRGMYNPEEFFEL